MLTVSVLKKVFYMKCILYLFTAKGSVVSLKYNHPEEKKCLSLGFQLTIFSKLYSKF